MRGRRRRSGLVATIALVGAVVVSVAGAGSRAVPARGTILISTTRAPDLHDELWVLDVRTGRRTNFSQGPTHDGEPAVSPGGSVVAFVSDRRGAEEVWIRATNGGAPRRLAGPFTPQNLRGVKVQRLDWSPDGAHLTAWIATIRGANDVRVISYPSGAARRIALGGSDPAWSPTGRQLTVNRFIQGRPFTEFREVGGRLIRRLPGLNIGWSTRGEAALTVNGRVTVVDADGRIRWSVPGSGGAWSPDGRLLAISPSSTGIHLADTMGRVRVLSRTLQLGSNPWAPDGRSLIASTPTSTVRITVSGRMTVLDRQVTAVAWARDGALALSMFRQVTIRGRGAPRRFAIAGVDGLCPSGLHGLVWLDRDRVLYAAGAGGKLQGDVWTVDRTGRTQRRFLGSEEWEGPLVWRSTGDVAVYEHGDTLTLGGGCEGPYLPHLRLAEPDGAVQVLTRPAQGVLHDSAPRWSPDGSLVAFARGSISDPAAFGIFAVDVASGDERQLTRGIDHSPSWSADGSAVVFQRGNGADIRRVLAASGEVSPVTQGQSPEASPRSPLVAFVRDDALWTVDLDGAGARRLAAVQPVAASRSFMRATQRPRWSPDGRRIALAERPGIIVVDADGRNARRIAAPGARRVEWSPDGRTLAFTLPVGNYSRGLFSGAHVARTELFVVPAIGGTPTRLTRDYANVLGIAWRP